MHFIMLLAVIVMVVLVVCFLKLFMLFMLELLAMWLHIHLRVCPQKAMYTCVHSFGALRFFYNRCVVAAAAATVTVTGADNNQLKATAEEAAGLRWQLWWW